MGEGKGKMAVWAGDRGNDGPGLCRVGLGKSGLDKGSGILGMLELFGLIR